MNDVFIVPPHSIDSKISGFIENFTPTRLNFSEQVIDEARNLLVNTQFPSSKNERWKYTRTNKIAQLKLSERLQTNIEAIALPLNNTPTIVFVNGVFNQQFSSIEQVPSGLTILPLSQVENVQQWLGKIADTSKDPFATINTLYAQDGAFVKVKKNARIHTPIQIVHLLTDKNTATCTRNFILCEEDSQAQVVQVFISQNAIYSLNNNVTEVYIATNAHLTFNKIQNIEVENFHLSAEYISQQKNSCFTENTATINGDFIRNDLWVVSEDQNTQTELNGVYVLKGKQHVDNHVSVEHRATNCSSNQLYKGVVDQQATSVFNGRVMVAPQAQKINAYQSNANVLLSDDASVYSKPELEIFADDVKCSHGTTIGQIDNEAIYYLRTRGISQQMAQNMLLKAFLGEVIDKIDNAELNSFIKETIDLP